MSKKQLIINLSSIYISIFLSALPFGMMAVLIAVKMNKFVGNEMLISLSASMQILAGIFFAKYLPRFAKKFGVSKSIQIFTVLAAITSLLMYNYVGYFIWLMTIFVFGIALFSFSVIRQSITLDISPTQHKAIIISAGGMCMSLGNAFGAAILHYIGSDGFFPHIIIALLYLSSMLPILLFRNLNSIVKEDKKISFIRYIKISPKIMFGGFTFNYVQASVSTFIIIYGLKTGMKIDQSALLLSILLFGTIFSIPMGYITDLINRRFLMLIFTTLSLLCSILLAFTNNFTIMATLLFLLFGFLIGIKLPALILINEKYKPTQRLAVNSAFYKICLTGNIVGIFITGGIMELYGPKGLWFSIIVILFLYLTFSLHNYWKKIISGLPIFQQIILKRNIN